MRALGAVLVLLIAVPPASAQDDNAISPAGVAAKPAAQTSKFRNPAIRPAAWRSRPAIQRAHPPAQATATASATASEGAIRLAAAAARKRAPTPPGAARDAATPLADRVALQIDLAWSGDYNGLVNGEINDKTTAATIRRPRPSWIRSWS